MAREGAGVLNSQGKQYFVFYYRYIYDEGVEYRIFLLLNGRRSCLRCAIRTMTAAGKVISTFPISHHARVLEGVAKSQFPARQWFSRVNSRTQMRSIFVYPLEHSGVAQG